MRRKIHTHRKGFTLIELLVAVTVIGVLAAIGFVSYGGMQRRATEGVLRSDLTTASELLHLDKIRTGTFPEDIHAADRNNGLPASSGTTYQYTVDNAIDPPTFCLTAINGSAAFFITEDGVVQPGVCTGHTEPTV